MGEARVLIFRPPAEVYAHLEARLLAEAGLTELKPDTPAVVRALARHSQPAPITVAERVPPGRLVITQSDPRGGTLTATFLISENPAGSTVRYTVEVQGKGLFKLATKAAGKLLEHLGPKVLAEIKDELEGRA